MSELKLTHDLVITAEQAIKSFQPTSQLRFAVPDGPTTDLNRLQQAFRCVETGELAWRDVPTVVVPGLLRRASIS